MRALRRHWLRLSLEYFCRWLARLVLRPQHLQAILVGRRPRALRSACFSPCTSQLTEQVWPKRQATCLRLHDRVRNSNADDKARIYLTREARDSLAKLGPSQRAALRAGFARVGWQLLSSAQRVTVEPGWERGTRRRRRYPQQCYAKTSRYVLDHAEIAGMRLIHGVVSHPPLSVPLEHAWVELPGDIVFDGVLQTFFTRASYYAIMAAMPVDAYSAADTRRLMASQGHPGPWNAKWVPTSAQLEAYAAGVPARRARQ